VNRDAALNHTGKTLCVAAWPNRTKIHASGIANRRPRTVHTAPAQIETTAEYARVMAAKSAPRVKSAFNGT
jgi:hypothetical protein